LAELSTGQEFDLRVLTPAKAGRNQLNK